MRKKLGGLALIFLVCVGVLGTILCLVSGLTGGLILRAEHSVTDGTVVMAQPQSHGSVTVRYFVNGETYDKTWAPYNWNVGKRVKIYYSPADPRTALFIEPTEFVSQQLPSIV